MVVASHVEAEQLEDPGPLPEASPEGDGDSKEPILNPEDAPVSLSQAQDAAEARSGDQGYMARFGRITFVLGVLCLLAGLAVWMFRSGEHRSALLLLVMAMFLAILHNYSLEDSNGKPKA